VIRSKGHFWLATRPQWLGELSQAGRHRALRSDGILVGGCTRRPLAQRSVLAKVAEKNWNEIYGGPQAGDRPSSARHG